MVLPTCPRGKYGKKSPSFRNSYLESRQVCSYLPLPQLTSDYTFAGLLSVKNELPKAFQAADLFVCPSIEDAGPMMVNQAIMSGTPVVAFEMGVALDLVHTGVTGYRARLKDSDDLAKGMKDILSLSEIELTKMRENCRNMGLSKGTTAVQAERIEEIVRGDH